MKIKGFDEDLCCRGMQYEIGKEYKTSATNLSKNDLCTNKVLHYCDSLINVHEYYSCNSDNRYCEIEVLGEEVTDGLKFGSNHIRIVREIVGEELNALMGKINGNTGLFNAGSRNAGYWNAGDRNTGYWNTGYWNTGDCNAGNWNTGNWNTGYWNTGDWNTGNFNTGKRNTGDRNTGNWNTGDRNTGDWNTGDRNTGDWNTCNNSNGVFCRKEPTIKLFDVDSRYTLSEFRNSKYYRALTSSSFKLIDWVEYTDEEKKEDIDKAMIGGYLKEYTYKEACEYWWKNMSEDNKMTILSIPNFDKTVFENITGIII